MEVLTSIMSFLATTAVLIAIAGLLFMSLWGFLVGIETTGAATSKLVNGKQQHWRERVEAARNPAVSLLRGSSEPEMPMEQLVRPAYGTDAAEADELVRPHTGSQVNRDY